jgi:hypothetical protein
LSSGFLLDRFFAPRVSQAFLLAPIAGIAALALGASGWLALVSGEWRTPAAATASCSGITSLH